MENLRFRQIHNIAIASLGKDKDSSLEVVGRWYLKFLSSEESRLTLHIPVFSLEYVTLASDYLRVVTFLYQIFNNSETTSLEGKCLIDVFNKTSGQKGQKVSLDFIRMKSNLALWENSTLTKLDSFLPVFNKEDVVGLKINESTLWTFSVFRKLQDSKQLNHPVLIDPKPRQLFFENFESSRVSLLSEIVFPLETRLSRKEAKQVAEEIPDDLKNTIAIKYPYSIQPTFPLTELGEKKFTLVFKNRFAYNEILANDIVLLKHENISESNLDIIVVETHHEKELFQLFKSFREQWSLLGLNKYISPFPKYWFMFLNPSMSEEQWINQFKSDFPAVANKPIINTIEKLIAHIRNLNWIETLLDDNTVFVFPELRSSRKKRLEFVLNSFKKYVTTINPNVAFSNSLENENLDNVIVVDPFNVIDLVNKAQDYFESRIKVAVPDFLYFGYNPWLKYHVFDFLYTPLKSGLRAKLDSDNFQANNEKYEHLKSRVIREITSELKRYTNQYEPYEEVVINEPDLEYTNEEESEAYQKEEESDFFKIVINEGEVNEIILTSSSNVLVQKDSLIYINAGQLVIGDLFLFHEQISALYKNQSLYDKLLNVPDSTLNFQKLLSQEENIYQKLKLRGISYQGEDYFSKNYIKNDRKREEFRIPRRKRDWAIICDYLNINKADQHQTFIAYYGRRKQNELKQMYNEIIQLLLDEEWIGTMENPIVVESVSQIVEKYIDIFNTVDTIDSEDLSESVIATILEHLVFTEVKTVRHE